MLCKIVQRWAWRHFFVSKNPAKPKRTFLWSGTWSSRESTCFYVGCCYLRKHTVVESDNAFSHFVHPAIYILLLVFKVVKNKVCVRYVFLLPSSARLQFWLLSLSSTCFQHTAEVSLVKQEWTLAVVTNLTLHQLIAFHSLYMQIQKRPLVWFLFDF